MRYAMIMAGGAGTRLWPMSRAKTPKQLIPFIGGKSLLRIAMERLEGLVPQERQYICAGQMHRDAVLAALPGFDRSRFLGEPTGRDTLNAVGFAAAVLAQRDPGAVIAVFTADHIIEPVGKFRTVVQRGYELAEQDADTLVTFGITPTHAATGYGYLELGEPVGTAAGARVVSEFREKPKAPVAQQYVGAGPDKYLWNSGMFVWRAATLMRCIGKYRPGNFDGLSRIAGAWDTDDADAVVEAVFPTLDKISVDFAVMEPASKDEAFRVVAVPMPVTWLDVGSWPAFAKTCPTDDAGNALGGGRHVAPDSKNNLLASSDDQHVIAAIGCEDLIVIHTPDATLVCPKDKAERIKELHKAVGEQFGDALL